MIQMNDLTIDTILENLKDRFEKKVIYVSFIGFLESDGMRKHCLLHPDCLAVSLFLD